MRRIFPACFSACLALACGTPDTETDTHPDTDTDTQVDPCEVLGLPSIPFDDTATGEPLRRELAPDFTVPLFRGETFRLSESWTGCDVHVIVPNSVPISAANRDSVWTTDIADLIERSPRNARYIFIPRTVNVSLATQAVQDLKERVDAALEALDEDEAAWWRDRLIVAAKGSNTLDTWIGPVFQNGHGAAGLTIDRFQRVRGMGSMAAVDAYNQQLADAGGWPWEARLYTAAKEADYLNYEADRALAMEQVDALVVPVLPGTVEEEYVDTVVELPSAETLAAYDTLEVEVIMECPDPQAPEVGNCGPWDYLAHLWLRDEELGQREIARFITTYHRESHWVVDASQALPWLAAGGEHALRYQWAPSWNTQPTGVTVNLRFSKQRPAPPMATLPLYTGGALNANYNADRPPMTVQVPPGASRVELVALITGHGADTSNCAEFCNHQHRFTVAGQEIFWEFPEASGTYHCRDTVGEGTVPNQGGTWWFGRGGWCPGVEVRPLVADVTEAAQAGEIEVTYQASVNGREPDGNYGNVRLSSWLVVYD